MSDLSPLEVLREEHQKVLQFNDDDQMMFELAGSVMLAAMNPHLLEPVWMYIIGPPGSGKTESVNPYDGQEYTVFISTMTENLLASGYRDDDGNDPSLLLTLNGKILVVKDISSLVNDNSAKIMKIWGDLRDAYDGMFSKGTGITGVQEYRARFGVLMCCTGAIDAFVETHQQLGERFLSFRIQRVPLGLEERFGLGERIADSMVGKTAWKAHLKQVVDEQMKQAKQFVVGNPGLPGVDSGLKRDVLMIANFLSMLRTTPIDGNVESPELPNRLVQQLLTLGHARAMLDGRMEWNEGDMDLIRRVAMDTFQVSKRRLVQTLFNRGDRRPFSARPYLLKHCRMNEKLMDATLMQYEYMDLVEYDIDQETKEVRGYRLTKPLYDAIKSTKFFDGRHMPS